MEKQRARAMGIQLISNDRFAQLAAELGQQIKKEYDQNDLDLPRIVIVPMGGWRVAEPVLNQLGIHPVDALSIHVERISEDRSLILTDRFKHGQTPSPKDIAGKELLLLDDASSNGDTLRYASSVLLDHGAAEVRTAVVFDSLPHFSCNDTPEGFRPDFSVINNGLGRVLSRSEL